MVPMELGQLQAFEAVAREGSFTRAAESLGLTQPAVSVRVSQLEAELGGPLFERGGRGLRLTPMGQTFLPYAERALSAVTDGAQVVQRHLEGTAGRVAVVAIDTIAMVLLPKPFARFRREYPSVDITIRLRIGQSILAHLHRGTANLGLTAAPLWDHGMRVLAHFQEPVRAVVGSGHPLTKRGPLTLEDLYQHTIYRVSLSKHVTALVEGIAEQARQGSGGAMIVIPAQMAVGILLEGRGVAFLPQSYVQAYVDSGGLTFLDVTDLPQMFNEPLLICAEGRDLDAPTAAFVAMVRRQWRALLVD